MAEWRRVSWRGAEPGRLAREIWAMQAGAPEMGWDGVKWCGHFPAWPFERRRPDGLLELLGGRRFRVEVAYPESFPMVPPRFVPLDPSPSLGVRTMHEWHVNGDGTLCLFQ